MDEVREKVKKALEYRLSSLVKVSGTERSFVENLRKWGINPNFQDEEAIENGDHYCVEFGERVINIKRNHDAQPAVQYTCSLHKGVNGDLVPSFSCEVMNLDTALTYLQYSKGFEEYFKRRIEEQQERFRIVDEILMEAEGKDKGTWEPKPMPHLGGSDIENEELARSVATAPSSDKSEVFPTSEEVRAVFDNFFDDDKNGEPVYPDDEENEAEAPSEARQEVPEEAPESANQEEAENPELSVEDKMAVNVVKQAKNPWEAMRVLHSLGYEASEFTKYGIDKEAVEEYQKTLEK